MATSPTIQRSGLTSRSKKIAAGILGLLTAATLNPALAPAASLTADGYTFTNFAFPNSGFLAGTGTNVNGIANNGAAVGTNLDNNGTLTNFIRNPDGTTTMLNLQGSSPQALAINSLGTVIGLVNGVGFILPHGGAQATLTNPAGATAALGINDNGTIVGQYSANGSSPGFALTGNNLLTINAPQGSNIVNPQGVNNKGEVVGFYLGTDGQDHGFDANLIVGRNGALTGTGISDPGLPGVPGEPGATFVFSQILGVNDSGLAVGYYGDSTGSQHGFFYNTQSGVYTFLDDPAEQFYNGVETTQITGITDSGEIAGFYSNSFGSFDGFVACPIGLTCTASAVPEPASPLLALFGLCALASNYLLNRRRSLAKPELLNYEEFR